MKHCCVILFLAGCASVADRWQDCGCEGDEICVMGDDGDTCAALPDACEPRCGGGEACGPAVEALCGTASLTRAECRTESAGGYGYIVECEG